MSTLTYISWKKKKKYQHLLLKKNTIFECKAKARNQSHIFYIEIIKLFASEAQVQYSNK